MKRRDVLRWLGLGVITLVTAPVVLAEPAEVLTFGNRFIQPGVWQGRGRPLTYEMLTDCMKNVYVAMIREEVDRSHSLYYSLAGVSE